ncbi:MAG TPA: PPK2 family polyphosphate kinase [Armatimonadaceae bacterium]|nr:PPK2 family polyphosphate kinase [Armatimonadaceae bacterium]
MLAIKCDAPGKVKLGKVPTKENGGLKEEQAAARLAELKQELADLQELMYAAGKNALLVVVQGRDTAGKDGTIKSVADAMNPVGVRVASFKVPTAAELAHDFLWRVHRETPEIGQVVFFNRSHYEDVLVVRVKELAPKSLWKKRYAHINDFEDLLADHGVIVVKFYLHISKEEQAKRLVAREKEPKKSWKLNAGDWKEREFWEEYTAAYDDVLEKCSTPHAPWFIVPADSKWYRNLAVAEALAQTLRPYRGAWEEALAQTGKVRRAELDLLRAEGKIG